MPTHLRMSYEFGPADPVVGPFLNLPIHLKRPVVLPISTVPPIPPGQTLLPKRPARHLLLRPLSRISTAVFASNIALDYARSIWSPSRPRLARAAHASMCSSYRSGQPSWRQTPTAPVPTPQLSFSNANAAWPSRTTSPRQMTSRRPPDRRTRPRDRVPSVTTGIAPVESRQTSYHCAMELKTPISLGRAAGWSSGLFMFPGSAH